MISINLTTNQKIQIGFIVMALGVAVFFIFYAGRAVFDPTVTSWTFTREFGKNGTPRITPTNPLEPKFNQDVLGFGCTDGKLEVIRYPNNPDKAIKLVFFFEERGGARQYKYFKHPMAPIQAFKDPFEKGLAYATYHSIYAVSKGLLGGIGLTPEQLAREAELRKKMNDEILVIDSRVDSGTFRKDKFDAFLKALAAFNAKPGAAESSKEKSELARAVLETASAYLEQIQIDKNKSIDTYLAAMKAMMNDDQRKRLAEAAEKSMNPPPPAAGRRGGAPPVTRRGPAPGAPPATRAGRGRANPPATAPKVEQ